MLVVGEGPIRSIVIYFIKISAFVQEDIGMNIKRIQLQDQKGGHFVKHLSSNNGRVTDHSIYFYKNRIIASALRLIYWNCETQFICGARS